jgi:hypothetical protein
VTRTGACRCGVVRFAIDGPVRDVIVCHCNACREVNGAPWRASAALRVDLTVEDASALVWERAAVSAHGARRATCRRCGSYVFWDAPGRETVSFGADLLADGDDPAVAAHIWVPETDRDALVAAGLRVEAEGLPPGVSVGWSGTTG